MIVSFQNEMSASKKNETHPINYVVHKYLTDFILPSDIAILACLNDKFQVEFLILNILLRGFLVKITF